MNLGAGFIYKWKGLWHLLFAFVSVFLCVEKNLQRLISGLSLVWPQFGSYKSHGITAFVAYLCVAIVILYFSYCFLCTLGKVEVIISLALGSSSSFGLFSFLS